MNSTIPHIIHYCWFGSTKKPKEVQAFIDSWKVKLPDYTFMEWNEGNCDLSNEIDYVKEAYEAKKYAFVSDYIRVKKLVEYGGIYLDTDVRIVRRFDKLLDKHDLVVGFQGAGRLKMLMKFIPGKHTTLPGIREFRCSEITFRCPGMVLDVDGELIPMDEARYRILPAAAGVRRPER